MQNFVQTLREKAQAAIDDPDNPIKNYHDLANKADIDPGNFSKFMRAQEGQYGNISFAKAARILYSIGGYIVFPGDKAHVIDAQQFKQLQNENTELRASVRTLQETIAMLASSQTNKELEQEAEHKKIPNIVNR